MDETLRGRAAFGLGTLQSGFWFGFGLELVRAYVRDESFASDALALYYLVVDASVCEAFVFF